MFTKINSKLNRISNSTKTCLDALIIPMMMSKVSARTVYVAFASGVQLESIEIIILSILMSWRKKILRIK